MVPWLDSKHSPQHVFFYPKWMKVNESQEAGFVFKKTMHTQLTALEYCSCPLYCTLVYPHPMLSMELFVDDRHQVVYWWKQSIYLRDGDRFSILGTLSCAKKWKIEILFSSLCSLKQRWHYLLDPVMSSQPLREKGFLINHKHLQQNIFKPVYTQVLKHAYIVCHRFHFPCGKCFNIY